jgi:hypothetical protein
VGSAPARLSILVAGALVAAPGCGLMLGAIATHNSRDRCRGNDPAFAVIDLVSAAASLGVLVEMGKLDESLGWLAVPGVLAAVGTLEAIGAARCRRGHKTGGETYDYRIAPAEPAADPDPDLTSAPMPGSLRMRAGESGADPVCDDPEGGDCVPDR